VCVGLAFSTLTPSAVTTSPIDKITQGVSVRISSQVETRLCGRLSSVWIGVAPKFI
jgi:hypothetical protein